MFIILHMMMSILYTFTLKVQYQTLGFLLRLTCICVYVYLYGGLHYSVGLYLAFYVTSVCMFVLHNNLYILAAFAQLGVG